MRKNLGFRAWFYFRQGWSTYFAFIFAAINTLVVTYYLAIERAPFLKILFPSFLNYVFVMVAIGIPLLFFMGYFHYKKSAAYAAEADITFESHPQLRKILQNTEMMLPMYVSISKILVKLSNGDKITSDELKELSRLQNEIEALLKEKS